MPDGLRIAFVSAPGGSAFMQEILAAVAYETGRCGVSVLTHTGVVEDVADGNTVNVVVPHEYFALAGSPPTDLLQRTISFGVEHPGTDTFDVSASASATVAARFEISSESTAELAARGIRAEHFILGYSELWDQWRQAEQVRPVDVLYMGTAEPGRLQALARMTRDLWDLRAELIVPPHEQMTIDRPYFLTGSRKWSLLASSKVLVNLHRESKTALEWVRTLEAMCNGCVVLTEPSTDLGQLVPGEHLLVARRSCLGSALRGALADREYLANLADSAYAFCKNQMNMTESVARLVDVANTLLPGQGTNAAYSGRPQAALAPGVRTSPVTEAPMTLWLPEAGGLPTDADRLDARAAWTATKLLELRRRLPQITASRSGRGKACVDVICSDHAAAGPLSVTRASLGAQSTPANFHVAYVGGDDNVRVPDHVDAFVQCTETAALGTARNALLERSSAPYVLVVDSGDRLLPGVLDKMVSALHHDRTIVVTYTIAALGTDTLVNFLPPESRRLERFMYLARGYVARRDWVEELGGFVDDPMLDPFLDHVFWSATALSGRAVQQFRFVGVQLWPAAITRMPMADPVTISEALTARRASSNRRLSSSRA